MRYFYSVTEEGKASLFLDEGKTQHAGFIHFDDETLDLALWDCLLKHNNCGNDDGCPLNDDLPF
jgi:hypothetical protein